MHPSLQTLPASILLLIAQYVSPPLLKHAFRLPGYRASHRSLVAASSTCHALRRACFPLAIRIFRNHDPEPLSRADIGASATELERRIEWVLSREDLWGHIRYVHIRSIRTGIEWGRMIDIELYARGSCSLSKHLATLVSSLSHLESFAIRLPTYRIFRDALTLDLRAAFSKCVSVRTLCVDADSAWLVPHFVNLRELVVWCWPKPGVCEDDRVDGWKTLLGSIHAQAPNVSELEIGGLSIWDVNQVFPALANGLGNVRVLRVLHRSEPYGAMALSTPWNRVLPSTIRSSARQLWEDSQTDPDYEGRFIQGCPGGVKKLVYFGLQDECGSCYVPACGRWKDVGPAVVLGSEDMRDRG
ncbi:hypothetical protein RSAG8_10849, partial [Rhizoctonia solani AG-8 WAC10335]